MTSVRPVQRARPDPVYEGLRDLIVHGRLAPGTRLVESDVARRFGVSRTPVRGAFLRLQSEGYLQGSPALRQTRPSVAPLTREDAHELFFIVGELEGLAAFHAAALEAAARRALADRLDETNDAFARAAVAVRPAHGRLFELDERFHRLYVEAGAGPRLLALHDAVKPQAERYERLYVSLLASEIPRSVKEHQAISRAIRAGDEDRAQSAVRINWRNAARRLAAVIDRAGGRGGW